MKIKLTVTALVCVIAVCIGVYAINGNDLTNDPLISLSYLNEIFWPRVEKAISDSVAGLKADIDDVKDSDTEQVPEQTPENDDAVTDAPVASSAEYEVLHLIQGDIVLAETACELILRSGSASAYLSGNESGIADLTAGVDLAEGEEFTANHLLLVPRGGDGRGFIVTSAEAYIMVRGGYDIVTE